MTLGLGGGAPERDEFLPRVEGLYDDAAADLLGLLDELRDGKSERLKAFVAHLRELRGAAQLVLEERARLAKLRKQQEGVVHDYALDFAAARAEIGRRLACLRDAGPGG